MRAFKTDIILFFALLFLALGIKLFSQTLVRDTQLAFANPSTPVLAGINTNGKSIQILPGSCFTISASPFTLNLNPSCVSSSTVQTHEDEVPIGTLDGVNNVFTIAHPFVQNTQHLYRNGVRLSPATGDYGITGQTVTFISGPSTTPQVGDKLEIDYICQGSGC